MNDIFVLVEHKNGRLLESSLELITLARILAAKISSKTNAVLLAENASTFIEQIKTKVDQIFFAEDKKLADFNCGYYQKIFMELLKLHNPAAILMSHNSSSVELAPSLAYKLNAGLISDCVDLNFTENNFLATRKVYEGKISSVVGYEKSQTVIATIQPGSYQTGTENAVPVDAQITKINIELEDNEYKKLLEYIESKTEGIDISASPIIVSVGRGIKEEKNMALVQELADALGAPLACSRPVVDKGWLPKDRQVGTSGKVIKPKLYIAVGISGSFQHIAGMKNSENIIAINKDPRAPIFEVAHFAIVEDLFKVIPALTKKIKAGVRS